MITGGPTATDRLEIIFKVLFLIEQSDHGAKGSVR